MVFKADRRLWVDKNRSKVVEEGDPEAAFLLAPVDGELTDEEATKYGLSGRKQVRGSAENKQVLPTDQEDKQAEQAAGEKSANEQSAEVVVAPKSQQVAPKGDAAPESGVTLKRAT